MAEGFQSESYKIARIDLAKKEAAVKAAETAHGDQRVILEAEANRSTEETITSEGKNKLKETTRKVAQGTKLTPYAMSKIVGESRDKLSIAQTDFAEAKAKLDLVEQEEKNAYEQARITQEKEIVELIMEEANKIDGDDIEQIYSAIAMGGKLTSVMVGGKAAPDKHFELKNVPDLRNDVKRLRKAAIERNISPDMLSNDIDKINSSYRDLLSHRSELDSKDFADVETKIRSALEEAIAVKFNENIAAPVNPSTDKYDVLKSILNSAEPALLTSTLRTKFLERINSQMKKDVDQTVTEITTAWANIQRDVSSDPMHAEDEIYKKIVAERLGNSREAILLLDASLPNRSEVNLADKIATEAALIRAGSGNAIDDAATYLINNATFNVSQLSRYRENAKKWENIIKKKSEYISGNGNLLRFGNLLRGIKNIPFKILGYKPGTRKCFRHLTSTRNYIKAN